ncbi:hypothetical protein hmeg3_18050 [Herbaspirillum sp. meg3]|uniref:lysozyme inhibitor LprI family protein n=1 Tax=Herbaspirillum sp. meg3 TaxID=2025949 RepID=UPI000B986809|nr:hypothetical protein [Herbaspirillum sp. meg3]ASU40006.1 hypothetical protein hmeg3_18050 [Herbaspirillum sp. meg3]
MSQIQRLFASALAPLSPDGTRHRIVFSASDWKRRLLLATLLSGVVTSAFGASFNCSKAGSATEKIICGDAELSRLDDQLGKTYKQAKAKAADRREFAARSDGFWRWREKNCQTRECLLDWYRQRQIALDAELSGISVASVATTVLQSLPASVSGQLASQPVNELANKPSQVVTPEQIQTALAQVQKLIAEPTHGNHLFLVSAAPQSVPAVPLQPHYLSVADGEYVYEDLNEATALDARPQVMVRYRGKVHGEYTLEVQKKAGRVRYTCDSDCAYIKQLMLPGYGLHDLDVVKNDHGSLASIMMRDAMNGLLVESE